MQNEPAKPPEEDRPSTAEQEAAKNNAVREAYFAAQGAPVPRPQFEVVSPATPPGTHTQNPPRVVYRRKVALPIVLFIATCASTFYAALQTLGPMPFDPRLAGLPGYWSEILQNNWVNSLQYMAAVIGILLFHEMGHFLQALRYRIPASLPFFIPMPGPPIGTMGAVIAMHGYQADRKQLFDIGLSGPLAGLLLAIPFAILGIKTSAVVPIVGGSWIEDPLLFKGLMWMLRSDIGPNETLLMNPWLMAAWVGLFVTGLNMFPVGQLDGGHVTYALFGRRAHLVARVFMVGALVYIITAQNYGWLLMYLLVFMMGMRHPPTANDAAPLSTGRKVLGLASLAIPIFCFTPNPFG